MRLCLTYTASFETRQRACWAILKYFARRQSKLSLKDTGTVRFWHKIAMRKGIHHLGQACHAEDGIDNHKRRYIFRDCRDDICPLLNAFSNFTLCDTPGLINLTGVPANFYCATTVFAGIAILRVLTLVVLARLWSFSLEQ